MKRKALVLAALGTLPIASVHSQVSIGPTGNAYELVIAEAISWDDANAASNGSTYLGISGHLATIFSASENGFVLSLLSNIGEAVWLGGSDAAEEGVWRWVTGERFWQGDATGTPGPDIMYANWDRTWGAEPNNCCSDEDFLTMFGPGSEPFLLNAAGSWNDLSPTTMTSGSYSIKGYVVEYEIAEVPLPGSIVLFGFGLAGVGLGAFRKRK
jgi:hypothetical protein